MPDSYIAGVSEAINRESREMERYKAIREGFPVGSSYIYIITVRFFRKLILSGILIGLE
ncbi:hypothetical protein [Clostridium sp.]|uniref:hypothetical protein n=1 Tax=Clostridium sp. TaxID=1506 RepID=UPI0026041ECC|nr:hypothetical protein [Clostridium sp.]